MTAGRDPADGTPGAAAWFRSLADGSGTVFLALRLRPDLAVEFVSDAVESLLGITPQAARTSATVMTDRIAPQDADRFAEVLGLPAGRVVDVDLTWSHPDGHRVPTRAWLRTTARPDGAVLLEGVLTAAALPSHAQRALEFSEQRYRLLVENAWDVIWTMALDGTITYVSPAVQRVRGITPDEAMHQTLEQIHPPESAARVVEYYQRLFAAIREGREPEVFRGEQEYYRSDGTIMTGELQVIPHVDTDGHVVEILGVTRDVSERRRYEAELTRLAVTDPLTGIWNRRHGEELLAAGLAESSRSGTVMTLLMMDIDRFKAINDGHGHPAGDRVIIEVAERVGRLLRGTDVLARWGGEEFVVLLRGCGLDAGIDLAQGMRTAVRSRPVRDVGTVTVSVGVAELAAGEDLRAWLSRADRALYAAKDAGRDTVRWQPADRP